MRTLCPSNPFVRIPLRIAESDGSVHGLLGGRPPKDVVPSSGGLSYFATVPLALEPRLDVSLFVAAYSKLLAVRGRLNEVGLVVPVTHAPAPRMTQPSEGTSQLTERFLIPLGEVDDLSDSEGDDENEQDFEGADGNKIGGRPHLVRRSRDLIASLKAAYQDGFMLVAQFAFPDDQDALVSGDWPFGDGVASVFGRPPFGPNDWRWYWDV